MKNCYPFVEIIQHRKLTSLKNFSSILITSFILLSNLHSEKLYQEESNSSTYDTKKPKPSLEIDEIIPSQKSNKTRFKGHVEIDKEKSLKVSMIAPYESTTKAAGSNLTVQGSIITQGGGIQIDPNNTLQVSTISPNSTKAAGSNLTVTGNLIVQGTTTLQDSTSVTGGTFTVGSSKMTVDSATGNTAIAGTATITGNTTISGTTTLGNNLTMNSGTLTVGSNKMTVSATTGNTTIAGTAAITGNTTISGTTTLGNNLTMNSGTFTIGSNQMTVSAANGNTTIAGTAAITGNTTISGTTTLGNNLTMNSGTFTVGSNKMVVSAATGNTTIAGTASITGNTTMSGNASIGGNATVTGTTTLNNDLTLNDASLIINKSASPFFTINQQANQITLNTAGLSYLIGEKNLSTISSITPTSVLTISFSNLLGVVTNISQGAQVKLKCFVSGVVGSIQTEIFYEGNVYLFPGNASNASCSIIPINEMSITTLGTSTTLTSHISGNGTSASITLLSSNQFQSQTAKLFYEVTGSNVSSVN